MVITGSSLHDQTPKLDVVESGSHYFIHQFLRHVRAIDVRPRGFYDAMPDAAGWSDRCPVRRRPHHTPAGILFSRRDSILSEAKRDGVWPLSFRMLGFLSQSRARAARLRGHQDLMPDAARSNSRYPARPYMHHVEVIVALHRRHYHREMLGEVVSGLCRPGRGHSLHFRGAISPLKLFHWIMPHEAE